MTEAYEPNPQVREFNMLVKQFLLELDACTTEQERIDKVKELVYGVSRSASKQERERYDNAQH